MEPKEGLEGLSLGLPYICTYLTLQLHYQPPPPHASRPLQVRAKQMLLCDGCDLGWHMDCLTPPLASQPLANWFCPGCLEHQVCVGTGTHHCFVSLTDSAQRQRQTAWAAFAGRLSHASAACLPHLFDGAVAATALCARCKECEACGTKAGHGGSGRKKGAAGAAPLDYCSGCGAVCHPGCMSGQEGQV